jgi:hypothetical protein
LIGLGVIGCLGVWRSKTTRALCACAIVVALAGCGGVLGGDECDDAAACGAPRTETAEHSPTVSHLTSGLPVTVQPGVKPRRDPEAVAKTVLKQLGPSAAIERITVVASAAEIRSVERNGSAHVGGVDLGGPVWVVRARGSFVGRRGPPGTSDIKSSSGYYVIDDASGEIIEMGLP